MHGTLHEEALQIRFPDPVVLSNPYGGQLTALDQPVDGHVRHPHGRRDLSDGQEAPAREGLLLAHPPTFSVRIQYSCGTCATLMLMCHMNPNEPHHETLGSSLSQTPPRRSLPLRCIAPQQQLDRIRPHLSESNCRPSRRLDQDATATGGRAAWTTLLSYWSGQGEIAWSHRRIDSVPRF